MNNEPREKILMIDDDVLVTEIIGTVLRNHGFRFESAANGIEGLEKARDLHPDLILLDISMPRMDGFQACRKLKEDPSNRKIPVVMLTASSERQSRIQALESGANDFLSKPVDSTELVVRVNNLLESKRYQDTLEEQGIIGPQQHGSQVREVLDFGIVDPVVEGEPEEEE